MRFGPDFFFRLGGNHATHSCIFDEGDFVVYFDLYSIALLGNTVQYVEVEAVSVRSSLGLRTVEIVELLVAYPKDFNALVVGAGLGHKGNGR